jgi:crotonobetainyl-CoA:carnitine CoA-transferase CaiB-like acyl-CoA transferase
MPLQGIRVLELSNHLAAPTASMYLADFGAELSKGIVIAAHRVASSG